MSQRKNPFIEGTKDWYEFESASRKTTCRCPFASPSGCQHFLASIELMQNCGDDRVSIPVQTITALRKKWPISVSDVIRDETIGIDLPTRNSNMQFGYSNCCPDLLGTIEGVYANSLKPRLEDERGLDGRERFADEHPLRHWRYIKAQHFTQCSHYASLAKPIASGTNKSSRKVRKPISDDLWWELLEDSRRKCCYCGKSPPQVSLEVDHVIPIAMGGTNDRSNLVVACARCNRGKSAKALRSEIAR